jgi:hypothetical protein
LRNVRFSFHCQRPFGFQQEAYSTLIGNTTGRPRLPRVSLLHETKNEVTVVGISGSYTGRADQ